MECKYCQKGFSKGEHLRRHERRHTGAKPFQCRECRRCFSRQDSLARHEKLHTRRQQPQESQSKHDSEYNPGTPESVLRNVESNNDPVNCVPNPSITSSRCHENKSQPHAPQQALHPSTALDFDLIWPDSEDLFQTLMSTDAAHQFQMPIGALPFSVSASPSPSDLAFATPSSFEERPSSIGAIPSGGNTQAVLDVSKMVSNLSSSVTMAAKSNSFTSVFLDECLHMFFVKFIPTFPILHRATFVFRDCARTLLLNAIAIGSLYLGQKDAVAKGETLWHLAHTAIATSWQTLITHRGEYDACEGVQLVITAVLGQVYGTLSKNRAIRTTSQAFHSLGFVWARRSGMFDCEPFDLRLVPSLDAPELDKDHQWRLWVSREIQQRALLAQYMLDGLVSQMSGEPTSVRHATNQLNLPSSEAAFEASTADEWISIIRLESPGDTTSFRTILRQLFRPTIEKHWINTALSAFSYKVILEGLQSLVSDDDTEETAVGVPTRSEVRHALCQVYEGITTNSFLSSNDRLETILRWHSICLNTIIDSSLLCRTLCSRYNITQHIWRNADQPKHRIDLVSWVTTSAARSAVLHAMAIQELVEQLPRGRAHAITMPSALFSAATVYSVFTLAGQPVMQIPCTVVWQDVLSSGRQTTTNSYLSLSELSASSQISLHETETTKYIQGNSPASSIGTTSRNLLYELNSMHKLFKCLYAQWGIASDMESVLEQWITLCH